MILYVFSVSGCCVVILGFNWWRDLVVVLCGFVKVFLLCFNVFLFNVLNFFWGINILLCILSLVGGLFIFKCSGILWIVWMLVVIFLFVVLLLWVVVWVRILFIYKILIVKLFNLGL